MKHSLASLLMLAITLPALAADPDPTQSTYRWVDEKGQTQYSDRPPPQSIKKFEERNVQPNRGNAQPPFQTRKAAASFPVTLYTSKDCGKPCEDGRALLQKRGVPFSETTIDTSTEIDSTMANSRNSRPTMPPIARMGMKAAISDRLIDSTVKPISRAPFSAARRGDMPASTWRAMFSSTTMASSTTKPVAMVRAISDRLSRL